MDKIRKLFWNMGLVPSRATLLVVGLGLTGCFAMIVFGMLLALTHDALFRVLIGLAAVPAILLLGGSAFAESWLFANRKERARLEKERMLDLLRRWLRNSSSEKDTPQL